MTLLTSSAQCGARPFSLVNYKSCQIIETFRHKWCLSWTLIRVRLNVHQCLLLIIISDLMCPTFSLRSWNAERVPILHAHIEL